ncbi:MAG TPA: hypothetical protein VK783_16200 [Bacteroidia bacterium]|jgi:hypothetical protein|nr:hypothetical protein [Bacteroidia bacterium]
MKTIKTSLILLMVMSISTAAFAKQGGLLGKAKEEAAKKKDAAKKAPKDKKSANVKGSGKEDIAVKGTGVPENNTTKTAPATTTPAPANK